MKNLQVLLTMESENPEELKRILDHHMEYLMDFENNKDVVTSIHHVMSYEETDIRKKLQVLRAVIQDCLTQEPDDDTLENDPSLLDVYDEIHNLKETLDQADPKIEQLKK